MSDDIRIGVFVCNCGTNIAGFLDCAEVAAYAQGLPGVVFTRENLYSCSQSGVTDIQNAIGEHNLNRVVVAACTPRTHEPLFRASCAQAGLNPFLFEFVNIREQCSWVHRKDNAEATAKAKDLIRMGVARAARLEPLTTISAGVERAALVVGGGIAGMTAALALADRGFEVKLVEREKELGGMLRRLHRVYPEGMPAAELLASRKGEVEAHPAIEVLTGARLTDLQGYIGNYRATVSAANGGRSEFKVGAVVAATGADLLEPEGLYGYDGEKVIHQLQMEERLARGAVGGKNVVFIKCVGARCAERLYCSRICCMTAVRQGLQIKELDPEARVHVLYRDIMSYGVDHEEELRRAKMKGVRFVNYTQAQPPALEDGALKVYSPLLGKELSLPCDVLVLVTPLVPAEGVEDLSRLLKAPLDADRFFLEAHVKLRPVDFAMDGIFVCGAAHWPANIYESIDQALGAAARAAIPLTNGEVSVEPIVSVLHDEEACRGCGLCAAVCPYGAIEMNETDHGTKARMIEVACKGCGTCGATCYVQAIKMNHYSNEQIGSQLAAAFAE